MALQRIFKLGHPCFYCSKTTKLLPGKHVINTSNPQPGRPGYMSSSGTSLKTGAAWVALTVATLPPSIACEFTDAYNLSYLAKQASHKVVIQFSEHTNPLAVPTVIQIQSTPSHPASLMPMSILSHHLCLCFPKGLSLLPFPNNTLYKMNHDNWWLILLTHTGRMYLL
jgi:hypothetical protein